MDILFIILLLIYVISIITIANKYEEKNIEPNFWSLSFIIVPILNTIFAIKISSISDFKKCIKEIKNSYKKFMDKIK